MSIFPDGRLIRDIRKERRLTQAELAEKSGFSKRVIEYIEGGRHRVRHHTLATIAEALGVPLERLTQTLKTLDDAMRLDHAGDFWGAVDIATRLRGLTKAGSTQHVELSIRLATFLDHANRLTEALQSLKEVQRTAKLDAHVTRWCTYQEGVIIRRLGEVAKLSIGPRAAAGLFAEARARFTPLASLRDTGMAVAALHQLGVIALTQGDFRAAVTIFNRCLKRRLAQAGSDTPGFRIGYEHRRLAQAYAALDRREKAREHFAHAARVARACQHWRLLGEVRRDLSALRFAAAPAKDAGALSTAPTGESVKRRTRRRGR